MKKILLIIILVIFIIWIIYHEKQKTIVIGSGTAGAMYYPVATSLCNVFNKYNHKYNIKCHAKITKGSEYNLHAIEEGEIDMGIVQNNLQHDAYMGYGEFSDHPYRNLRLLFDLHSEYLTIIAKKGSGIKKFSDILGKRINIGNIGSGSKILFSQMMDKIKWNFSDFAQIYEESGSDIDNLLCESNNNKEIADVAVYVVGHPNKSFEYVLDNCDTQLISLSESEIKDFIGLSPIYFRKEFIPANTYKSQNKAILTFATKASLTASKKLDSDIVYNFIKVLSEHKDELIAMQPSLRSIIFAPGAAAAVIPAHKGMEKYLSLNKHDTNITN